MRRFSIRSLMAFIIVAATGLAALRNANDLWAGSLLLLALAAIGIAVMGAVILRGKERHWSAGFAFFAGCYLVLAIGPWLSSWYGSRIGTTHLLDRLRDRMFASRREPLGDVQAKNLLAEKQALEAAIAQASRLSRDPGQDPAVQVRTRRLRAIVKLSANQDARPRSEDFHDVGHSLFAILAGFLGGVIAVRFYVRRERGGSAEPPAHPPENAMIADEVGG
jgi:hypothetical protein